jgi:SRSO17 transposase
MTKRVASPAAPEPLEAFACAFDDLFSHVAQRQAFREYLQGLLLPRERNKTVTGMIGAEPVVGASDADVQHLDGFVVESSWAAERINQRRLELLLGEAATASHERGALILDDSGDRKWGTTMAYTARQYLGSIGKVDHGIVAVTSVWADEAIYYPLHVRPYIPAERLPEGKQDSDFATKPQLALRLIDTALEAGVLFRAVVADCSYGEDRALVKELNAAGLPYVVVLKPSHEVRASEGQPHTPRVTAAARKGKRIAWLLRDGEYLARVV